MTSEGILRQNHFLVLAILKAVDATVIVLCLILSTLFYQQQWSSPQTITLAFCTIALYSFFASVSGLNTSWRAKEIGAEFQPLLYTRVGVLVCLLILGYITKTTAIYSRLAVSSWLVATPMVLLTVKSVARMILFRMCKKGFNSRRVAIVGTGELAQHLAKEITTQSWMDINIVGYYDNRATLRSTPDPGVDVNVIGRFEDLILAVRANQYDEVYITLSMKAEKVISQLVAELSDSSVPVHLVPDLFTSRSSQIGRIPMLSVYESPLDEQGVSVKRSQDLILGSLILALITVPMLIISIAIKLTSKRPAPFKQRRYGLGGEEIWIWKFRPMSICEDGENIQQAQNNDPRVTSICGFLRRTSLDELPQLINMLQGSMSIVGPRPHAVSHNELY